MDEAALRELLEVAAGDEGGAHSRVEVCRTLGSVLQRAGQTLWVGGT